MKYYLDYQYLYHKQQTDQQRYTMSKSILIADDHELVRNGLQFVVKEVLGFSTHIEFAGNGMQVIDKLKNGRFDMLLMDLCMPDTDELGLVTKVLSICPGLRILVITAKPDKVYATRFLKAGVMGYVNKSEPDAIISGAIRVISEGKKYVSHAQMELFTNMVISKASDSPFESLSNREFEVALLLLRGQGAMEIAKTLSISASTASTFRCRIFDKLCVKNVIELNRLARQYEIPLDFES